MGIWEVLHKKHGHRKDKIIQELLEEIKQLDTMILLQEQNEGHLIRDNEHKDKTISDQQKHIKILEEHLWKCRHPKPPKHGVSLDVVF